MKNLFFLLIYFICFLAKGQSDTLEMLMNNWYMKPSTENNMSTDSLLTSLFCNLNYSLNVEVHLAITYNVKSNTRNFKYKELVPFGSYSFDGYETCNTLGEAIYKSGNSKLIFNSNDISKVYHIIKINRDSLILKESLSNNIYRFYSDDFYRYHDDYLNYIFFEFVKNKTPKNSKITFFIKPKEHYLYNKKSDIIIEIVESSISKKKLLTLIKKFLNDKRKKYIRKANCNFIFISPIDYTEF